MNPSFDEIVEGVTKSGVSKLKESLGGAWDSFSSEEREQALRLLAALASTRLRELSGIALDDDTLLVLEAAYLQWDATVSLELSSAMKDAVRGILGMVGVVAGSALKTVVEGL